MKSLNLTKPHLIVVVGIPGAGKTYFGQQFSTTFNAPYLKYDELYEFSNDEAAVQHIWDYTLDKLAQTKQTLLLEGPGATRADRRQLSELAHAYGYQTLYIWVQTEPTTAQIRATKGVGRIKPLYPLTTKEFKERAELFEALSPSEHYMVISGKHTYASQAKNVLQKLTQTRSERAKATTTQERPKAPTSHTSASNRTGRITIN